MNNVFISDGDKTAKEISQNWHSHHNVSAEALLPPDAHPIKARYNDEELRTNHRQNNIPNTT